MADKAKDFDPILLPIGHSNVLEACPAARTSRRCIPEDSPMRVGEIVGAHRGCKEGTVRLQGLGTHNVLHCPNCSLRLEVPIEVGTYGQLREWANKEILKAGRGKRDSLLESL